MLPPCSPDPRTMGPIEPKKGKAMAAARRSDSAEQFNTGFTTAFAIFAAVNIIAAFTAPISDCDETFNYWEPTHYLNHGYGLQTWEYSPEFAIRSWTYIAIHALLGRLGYLLTFSKTFEFYWIRSLLGIACSYSEATLFSAISKSLNPRVAIMFMLILISAPGMFSASSAYLPSSFAMYANMLGVSAFLDWRSNSHTTVGIRWFGIGGIIGWPFAAALILPFAFEEIVMTWITEEWLDLLRRALLGCTHLVIITIVQVLIEAFFYHKAVLVPWNIVYYNLFSGSGKGPDIFGTEPADFYLRNLLLNFNVWTILALAAGPIIVLQYLLRTHSSALGVFRSLIITLPFYMWFGIFSLQSHKEERFMYPAYPFLAINAAIGLHTLLGWFGTADSRTLIGRIPSQIKFAAVGSGVSTAVILGCLRSMGSITAYRAPLKVYGELAHVSGAGAHTSLCLGKEWYRFPTSFFLPNDIHARFVKSEFRGLLPGQFSEAKTGFGLFPGTWLIPSGMNDQNIEDPGKYVGNHPSRSSWLRTDKQQSRLAQCDFLVDSMLPSHPPTALEPAHVNNTRAWDQVQCEPFLDAGSTHVLRRLFWLPDFSILPHRFRRQWGEYCLLRRRVGGRH